jgi:hypothetical protein
MTGPAWVQAVSTVVLVLITAYYAKRPATSRVQPVGRLMFRRTNDAASVLRRPR